MSIKYLMDAITMLSNLHILMGSDTGKFLVRGKARCMEEIEDIIASAEAEAGDLPDDEAPGEDTWTADDETCVVKRTDRHVFLFRETVLPEKVHAFFLPEGLEPGKKRKIVLWLENRRFDAFIERTLHDPPLTRMRWSADFASLLQKTYPEWYEYFRKSREEAEDTPVLFFTSRQESAEYNVAFDRALSKDALAEEGTALKKGEVITNERLREIFKCSSQGAMRRSLKTDSIVLVSDHTRPGCDDKWIGRTFHFTGVGLMGEQGLSFNQNKALCDADEKGTSIHLFEIFNNGQYTYVGEVGFADNPYLSRQADSTKNVRDVTVFPLMIRDKTRPRPIKKGTPETPDEIVRKKVQKLPLEELEFHAKYSLKETSRREVVSEVFNGDEIVAEYAKRRANGSCQLCSLSAPFRDHDGEPFLEIHHIIPLDEGGQDTIGNVVALCPNCHRKMHVLNLPADVVRLRNRVLTRD